MLLCVITVVTSELMRSLLIKLTVSFCVNITWKIYVIQGKHGKFHLGWNVASLCDVHSTVVGFFSRTFFSNVPLLIDSLKLLVIRKFFFSRSKTNDFTSAKG